MKKIILILFVIGALALPGAVFAIDGEISVGMFTDSNKRAHPDGGTAEFMSSLEVGHTFNDFIRPYVELITLSDAYNNNGTFHPSSIEYIVGAEIGLTDNLYLDVKHSCWHPIDKGGTVEQYNLFQMKYKFGKK